MKKTYYILKDNYIVNKIASDTEPLEDNYVAEGSFTGSAKLNSYLDSTTDTLKSSQQINIESSVLDTPSAVTSPFSITFSFSPNQTPSFTSSDIDVEFGSISEFSIDKECKFLVTPSTPDGNSNSDFLLTLDINDSNFKVYSEQKLEGDIWRLPLEVLCDSASFAS